MYKINFLAYSIKEANVHTSINWPKVSGLGSIVLAGSGLSAEAYKISINN
jgi:hypothetical protein